MIKLNHPYKSAKFKIYFVILFSILGIDHSIANAHAQEKAVAIGRVSDFNIPAGTLSQVIQSFSDQSGLQVIVSSDLIRDYSSPGFIGRSTAIDVLHQIVKEAPVYAEVYNNTVLITALSKNDEIKLDAVNVEGKNSDIYSPLKGINTTNLSAITGVNGSRDLTATEGNGSYARGNVSIGGRSPIDAQKIAQSVSVIGSQQLQDQKSVTIEDALKMAPGFFRQTFSGEINSYYARGSEVENFTVDGLFIPLVSNIIDDISLYDHIEILRGSDAFINRTISGSVSSPSASVNFVRKKPLDHLQILSDTSLGSWHMFRQSLDVTGPLDTEGKLRGRAILTHVNNDTFISGEHSEKTLGDLSLEYDISPDTTVSLGLNHAEKKGVTWFGSMPRRNDGVDLKLPLSFSSVMPGDYDNTHTSNIYLGLEYNFNEHLSFIGNSTKLALKRHTQYTPVYYLDGIDPLGGNSAFLSPQKMHDETYSWITNGSLLGQYEVFDLAQTIELAYQHGETKHILDYYYGDPLALNFNDIREVDFAHMQSSAINYTSSSIDTYQSLVDTLYLKFDFQLSKGLHFLTGLRWVKDQDISDNKKYKNKKLNIPYYGLRYDVNPLWSLYTSYTDIFSFQNNYATKNNEPLQPRTGNTKELGMKYTNEDRTFNFSFAFYRSLLDNPAEFVWDMTSAPNPTTGCCWTTNTYKKISHGVEVEFSGKILPGWDSVLSYAYNASHYTYTPKRISDAIVNAGNYPRHALKWGNAVSLSGNELLNRTKIGMNFVYYSKQNRITYEYDKNYNRYSANLDQSSYFVTDLFVNYQFNKQWSAQLNVNNVFDRRYYSGLSSLSSGARYGTPRNILFSIQAKY